MVKRSLCAMLDFLSPVSCIPGMGPKRVAALAESGIENIGDFLYNFPIRYIDRSEIIPLEKIGDYNGKICTVRGKISSVRLEYGRKQRLRMLLKDESGSVELLWFRGIQYYSRGFKDAVVIVTGKVMHYGRFQIVHPVMEKISEDEKVPLIKFAPRYSITKAMREAGIQQKLLIKAVSWSFKNLKHFPQVLPEIIEKKKEFPFLQKCLYEIHFPSDISCLEYYKERIYYEQLYKIVLTIKLSKRKFLLPGRSMDAGNLAERFKKTLPFELTEDQNMAISDLYRDAKSTKRMHRLLHGEVGSGKTLVAFFACLPALNAGYQVAWLAPTEVLARQTYKLILSWILPFGFKAELLTGGFTVSKRHSICNSLKEGKIDFIVGTHALLQTSVVFRSLGMIVIDEQHKFGVQQRLALQEKDPSSDFLLMSATPIPKTLAATFYGDLDITTIKKSPHGRSPVLTYLVPESKRFDMERFISELVSKGSRVYYVVPRIDNDLEMTNSGMKDLETVYRDLKKGSFSMYSVQCIHGKMKSEQKQKIMIDFANGETDILVTTTVIEVGINIPDATIMVIENADYYGLSQLHQLRGRVGRGNKRSYCFLLTTNYSNIDARKRLSVFSKTNDGFKIAELDLKNRGPGEMSGLKQSGWNDLLVTEIIKKPDLFKEIQREIDEIIPQ